jgi:hypothetical protein
MNPDSSRLLGPDTVTKCVLFSWAGFQASTEAPTILDFNLEKWPAGISLGALNDDAPDACLILAGSTGPVLSRNALANAAAGILSDRRVSILAVNDEILARAVRQIEAVLEVGGTA